MHKITDGWLKRCVLSGRLYTGPARKCTGQSPGQIVDFRSFKIGSHSLAVDGDSGHLSPAMSESSRMKTWILE